MFFSASLALIALVSQVAASPALPVAERKDRPDVLDLKGRCDYRREVLKNLLPITGVACPSSEHLAQLVA